MSKKILLDNFITNEAYSHKPTCFEMGYGWDCPHRADKTTCKECKNEWLESLSEIELLEYFNCINYKEENENE